MDNRGYQNIIERTTANLSVCAGVDERAKERSDKIVVQNHRLRNQIKEMQQPQKRQGKDHVGVHHVDALSYSCEARTTGRLSSQKLVRWKIWRGGLIRSSLWILWPIKDDPTTNLTATTGHHKNRRATRETPWVTNTEEEGVRHRTHRLRKPIICHNCLGSHRPN